MSAPPLTRLVDERRVSVVHDATAVRWVLDTDPIGSCMVASRVAEHGVEPSAIGGELWTRRHTTESLCYAGANLIPLRGELDDLNAFADNVGWQIRALWQRSELIRNRVAAGALTVVGARYDVDTGGITLLTRGWR